MPLNFKSKWSVYSMPQKWEFCMRQYNIKYKWSMHILRQPEKACGSLTEQKVFVFCILSLFFPLMQFCQCKFPRGRAHCKFCRQDEVIACAPMQEFWIYENWNTLSAAGLCQTIEQTKPVRHQPVTPTYVQLVRYTNLGFYIKHCKFQYTSTFLP